MDIDYAHSVFSGGMKWKKSDSPLNVAFQKLLIEALNMNQS